ncbi:MAG: YraN family protein [Alphaproteobacteria bacterium]|nr:YraN family protein [Alphaproteobacteria bacterium]
MSRDEFPSRRHVAAERRGRRSELLAALYLKLKFYRILERRLRTRLGEIDLVARSPSGIICFIEVKARAMQDLALEAVLPRQQARIARAAQSFLASRPWLASAPVRFDILTISRRRWPRHIRGAWRPDDVGL